MGYLESGKWVDKWYDTKKTGGRFERKESYFRSWITPDGSAGPTGSNGYIAEKKRYHLYVSYACPWAHRTLILRMLKGLEKVVSLSVVSWQMGSDGWSFQEAEGVIPDNVNNVFHLHQLYTIANPDYSGRVTVPVLWDKKTRTIVSNESSEILRMFNSAFDQVGAKPGNYYPVHLQGEIDRLNELVYDRINNGVYKVGFATSQEANTDAVIRLFETLDYLESILSNRRYLTGNDITEADWRLFPTLVRFDAVYFGHFKCNLKRITDYPHLSGYLRDLYQQPGIAQTVNMEHIKKHYYISHTTINPTGIVPLGPELDFLAAHERG